VKHLFVWQVVRRARVKWGGIGPMVFPLANFDREEDALEAARILDEDPMPDGLTSREHTVERLEMFLFESVEEFEGARN